MKKIRALIADDSFFMRKVLSQLLTSDPNIEIVASAKNGKEAVELVKEHQPDVVTMDIEMPIMNGIEALKTIMTETPVPVIMVSSLTTEGAQFTMDALSIGAVDFIAKRQGFGSGETDGMKEELLEKIHIVASSFTIRRRMERLRRQKTGITAEPTAPAALLKRVRPPASAVTTSRTAIRPPHSHFKIAIIGVSTGGPLALHQIIPRLPANLPVPLLIVQHMPPYFTKSLSDRLNGVSQVEVVEAADGMVLQPGHVYIAPGGLQMLIDAGNRIHISQEKYDTLYKPSVDVTVRSVVQHFGGRALGIIMTGMGRDGAASLKELLASGGYVIAQNEDTCVVYGMPRAVVEDGTANEIHSLENLAEVISACLGCHFVLPEVTRPAVRNS
ncbi:MAG TPA: chemotaxis response regulator protein-glutamate methylesterase [Patescibacteria group bacterium]|nr:chemotaxis response regulator protein-glutamate methylesterase [Patescibacteria group bacterium]